MTTRLCVVLCGTVLAGGLLLPAPAAGQERARFQAMDLNRDGVISRDEWRGNDRSFRQQDRNGDGVLSRDEVREAGSVGTSGTAGALGSFEFVDLDTPLFMKGSPFCGGFELRADVIDVSLCQENVRRRPRTDRVE